MELILIYVFATWGEMYGARENKSYTKLKLEVYCNCASVIFAPVSLRLGKNLQQLKSLVADKGDLGLVAEVFLFMNVLNLLDFIVLMVFLA